MKGFPALLAGASRLGCSLFLLASAYAQEQRPPAPLFDGLGNHHHPVSTESKLAQRYFDQGLTLLYGFNHAEAIRSFQAAVKLDPDCAMAYWGIAYAHGPNINQPMSDEAVPKAWEALESAMALKEKITPRERDYIEALARRYQPEPVEDRSPLDLAYANAMREVASRHPDDLDAAVLFVEALMDTTPWDYWTQDHTPKPETEELLQALRSVLQRNPDHPGANHFLIHAVEAGPNPETGLPSADRLRHFAPSAGHLVHMPSHIYARVGQYHDASTANELAIAADRDYINQCRVQGYYPGLYYPHNIAFLWYTTGLEGRSADCLRAARRAANYALTAWCGTEVIEAPRLGHLPLLTHARFGQWQSILEARAPKEDRVIDRAMWHYTRGLAMLATGRGDEAAKENAMLANIAGSDAVREAENDFFPATGILAVATHVLAAKLAGEQGDSETKIQRLEQAVEAEDNLPYMEPPFWYYSVRQSLGSALLETGAFEEAEKVFREDLEILPRNGWALFGLETALRRQGKTDAAAAVSREFQAAWQHADTKLDLSWF